MKCILDVVSVLLVLALASCSYDKGTMRRRLAYLTGFNGKWAKSQGGRKFVF